MRREALHETPPSWANPMTSGPQGVGKTAAQSAAALKMPLRHLCRSAYLAASDKDGEKTLVSDLSKMRQKKTLFRT